MRCKEDKSFLRKKMLNKRDSISPKLKSIKDKKIKEKLLNLTEYKNANILLLFASFRTEVETLEIILETLKKGKIVILPKVDRKHKKLILYKIDNINELQPGYMGILEPKPAADKKVSKEILDFILVPGVAFDENGGRIGYGGGYYDRLISNIKNRPPLVAVAYEEQIIKKVPLFKHDIKVDKIVTDTRIIEICSNGVRNGS